MELDVVNYLSSDAPLRALLGSTAEDTKIYPSQAPQGAEFPYILYNCSGDGTTEENLLERTLDFNCVAETQLEAQQIHDMVVELLDYQDKIRRLIISLTYWFYWAKHTGGASYKDPELDVYYNVASVSFKYAKITIEDIEMIIKLSDRLGDFIDSTNPLPVISCPKESVREFGQVGPIAKGDWYTILTYTVTDEPVWIDSYFTTGNIEAEFSLFVDTVEMIPCRTSQQIRTGGNEFKTSQKFEVGTILDIKVRHWNDSDAYFKACLLGHKHTP